LPERQVSDVESAVNCLLKHMDNPLVQQAYQSIVKVGQGFFTSENYF
jgi:uncharacterized UBP type Zn finger protein